MDISDKKLKITLFGPVIKKSIEYILANSGYIEQFRWLEDPHLKRKEILHREVSGPDILIFTSIDAAGSILHIANDTKSILLLSEVKSKNIQMLLKYGFSGVMTVQDFIANPEYVLRQVYFDQIVYGDDIVDSLFSYLVAIGNSKEQLTTREMEVIRLLSKGKTYNDISLHLGISKETVKTHLSRVYAKLKVSNKSQAVIRALQANLI